MHWASINYSKGRAEWGWGGVGHALGFNSITLRLGPGYKDRPTGAGSGRVGPSRGRVGPVRAEWGWGVHWDSIK